MKMRPRQLTTFLLCILMLFSTPVSLCLAGAGNMIDFSDSSVQYLERDGINQPAGNTITVEFWFKGDFDTNLFRLSNLNYPYQFELKLYKINEDNLIASILDYTQSVRESGGSIPNSLIDGEWHHLALVWGAYGFKLYFDGVEFSTGPYYRYIRIRPNLRLTISPEGQVEEFRIWDHARSEAQIQEYKDRSLTGSEAGLALYYNFNESTGNIVHDNSGHGYDATINHTATGYPFWVPSTVLLDLPVVETEPVTDLSFNSVTLNGNVTYDGGDPVEARGFCWSTDGTPDLEDNVIIDPSPGPGAYSSEMTFLQEDTPYYVRAYVTNATGTTYGDQISFTTSIEPIPDPPGYAVLLDGDDAIDLHTPSSLSFAGTAPFTIETWIRPDVDNLTGIILAHYNAGVTGQYYLGLENGRAVVHREDGGSPLSGTSDLVAGRWCHVAAAYDGTTLSLYLDGSHEASQGSGAVAEVTTNILIGAWQANGTEARWFNGAVDELRIWDIYRSEPEIQSGMATLLSGSESNLVAWYSFDKTLQWPGQTVADDSGNDQNGITLGDPETVASAALGVPNVVNLGTEVVGLNFATVESRLVQEGGSAVNEWGICYNTTGKPGYSDTRKTGEAIDSQSGVFNTVLKELTPGSIYFARPYALSSDGIGYGDEVRFTTAMVSPGNALEFDSDQDAVKAAGVDLDSLTGYTVEFWLKTTTLGAAMVSNGSSYRVAFGLESSSYPERGHRIFADGNTILLPMDDPRRGFDAADNQWHHIAVTFAENDPTGFTSYFDGQLIGSRSTEGITPLWQSDNPLLLLGDSDAFNSPRFNGQLDEIRIWNRVKSGEEIFLDRFRTFFGDEEGLQVYYPL